MMPRMRIPEFDGEIWTAPTIFSVAEFVMCEKKSDEKDGRVPQGVLRGEASLVEYGTPKPKAKRVGNLGSLR